MDTTARTLEDELLVLRCQLGERAAFDALIDRWHDPLWRYARRVTGSDDAAADATQDVWLRVLRGLGRLREPASLRPWLFGIARRVLMDRLRLKYAEPATVDAADVDPAAEPIDDELGLEIASMQDALSRLPVVERDVLTLFYLRELTVADVARVLDVPTGTAKSRLFRARRLLRRELESPLSSGDRR